MSDPPFLQQAKTNPFLSSPIADYFRALVLAAVEMDPVLLARLENAVRSRTVVSSSNVMVEDLEALLVATAEIDLGYGPGDAVEAFPTYDADDHPSESTEQEVGHANETRCRLAIRLRNGVSDGPAVADPHDIVDDPAR